MDMNFLSILAIIAVTVILTIVVMYILIPFLIKKGINIGGVLSNTNTALDTIQLAFNSIKSLLPYNSKLELISSLITWAKAGADKAEQLYKSGQLEKEKRKKTAQDFVYDAIRAAGFEVTDDIVTVVDGAIDAAINLMPKTHDENGNIIK